MAAWFALTEGRYDDVVDYAQAGQQHAGLTNAMRIFYAATCYTWLGDDEPAEEHARELIACHTRPDGTSSAPMRTAMSHIDLGLIRARRGDLDEAVDHGLTAFSYDRKTEASLLSHAADLEQLLSDRYPDERLADEFHQRYQDTQTALRRKAHADS
jgi:hypothetical protein